MASQTNEIHSCQPSSPDPNPAGRDRAALLLGLLGIPSFGLTAIPGLVLGLAALRQRPRAWALGGTIVSTLVLAGWMGGLVGALEVMRRQVPLQTHHWPAGHQLGFRIADLASRAVDPERPESPSEQELMMIMERIPPGSRSYGLPPTPLVVEPLSAPAGVFLRCWIGAPADPNSEDGVDEVDRDRGAIFMFGFDGREVRAFDRVLDPNGAGFDDRETEALRKTLPAAQAIVDSVRAVDGVLPDSIEATRLIRPTGDEPHPRYRRRPGGVFDLEVPGSRQVVTYAALGGVYLPILP